MVVFPGDMDSMVVAWKAAVDAELNVDHLLWDKMYAVGTFGSRLDYKTENILLVSTKVIKHHNTLCVMHSVWL